LPWLNVGGFNDSLGQRQRSYEKLIYRDNFNALFGLFLER
jgi:hypothetical protein